MDNNSLGSVSMGNTPIGRRDIGIGAGRPIQQPMVEMRQQPQMQHNPMAMVKSMYAGNNNGRPRFDWDANSLNSGDGALSRLVNELGGNGNESVDLLRKAQVVQRLAQVMNAFQIDFDNGSTHAHSKYQFLMNNIESAKYIMNVNLQGQICPTRSFFVNEVKKNRALQIQIGKDAVYCASAVVGDLIVKQIVTDIEPNKFLEIFKQQCINFTMLQMINWFNKTQQGRSAYFKISSELREQINHLPRLIEDVANMFSFFETPNPYQELSVTVNIETSTAFSGATCHVEDLITYGNTMSANVTTCGTDMSDFAKQAEQQANLYRKEPEVVKNTYHENNLTSHSYTTTRNDYGNINSSNINDFDLGFLVKVPGYDDVYITQGSDWNVVKLFFNRSRGNKGLPSGIWENHDLLYLVTIDTGSDGSKFLWSDEIIRSEGLDVARTLLNPELVLPLLEVGPDGGVIVSNNNKVNVSTITTKEISAKNSMGDFMIIPDMINELEAMYVVVKDDLLKDTKEKNIESVIDILGSNLKDGSAKEQIIVNSHPVLIYKELKINNPKNIKLINDGMYIFVKGRKAKIGNFFSLMENINKIVVGYLNKEEPELCELLNTQISDTLQRWLSEKRGYEGIKVTNVVYDFKDVKTYLESAGDISTLECLYDFDKHKWVYEHCEIFADTFPELLKRIEADESDDASPECNNTYSLVVNREVIINRVNNFIGPTRVNEYINIKRSTFPEIFAMVESSYTKLTNEKTTKFVGTPDMLISFADTETLWSFTYSDFDSNVGILRQVHRSGGLINWVTL